MLKVLYGTLQINKKIDYLIVLIKILYILFTAPFLIFALLMFVRSFGAFRESKNERYSTFKKIMLHVAAIGWSCCMWIMVIGILEEVFNFNVNLHLFG